MRQKILENCRNWIDCFCFFPIIEGFEGNSYPHQANLNEYSARTIDEWKREEEKGHGMDWER